MPPEVTIRLNGIEVRVANGTSVAAAIQNEDVFALRRSETLEARGPLCGMGVCFECRATVDGHKHVRTCLIECRDGMVVQTDA